MNCTCKLLSNRKVLGLPTELRPRFVAGLAHSELAAVLSLASHRHLHASSTVIHEEDPAERVFLLTSGRGRHFVLTGSGRKILLHWLTAGQVFGGAAALSTPSRYFASTEILTDGCALVWDRKSIRELVTRFPKLLDNGLSIAVTEHIAWLIAARISLSHEDADSRIADFLISLACGIGKPGPEGFEVPVGNEDIASAASVSVFTVSRTLSAWQQIGILRKGRGKVILLQPELLAEQKDCPDLFPTSSRQASAS